MSVVDRLVGPHYGKPTGLLGRLAGRKMVSQHAAENAWTVALLQPQPEDRILEVGFGPGLAIEVLARTATCGRIAGIDHSRTMVAAAGRRNAAAIRTGRVELRHGSVEDLPFGDRSFDKAFAIHGLYFWPQPADALAELRRVLAPGGALILTILPKDKWLTNDGQLDPGSAVCVPYSGEDVVSMMRAAGFRRCSIRADADPRFPSNYSAIGIAPDSTDTVVITPL